MAGSPPARVDTLILPSISSRQAPQEHYQWAGSGCREVVFSTCGHWMAATLESKQQCSPQLRRQHYLLQETSVYEILVCTTSSGLQVHATVCTGSCEPVLKWSPSVPHQLGIAQLPEKACMASIFDVENIPREFHGQWVPFNRGCHADSNHPAAFVWDASTCAVLHSLGAQVSADFHKHIFSIFPECLQACAVSWSPADCWHLLVFESHGQCSAGQLSILDVQLDTVLVRCAVSGCDTAECPLFQKSWAPAIWHPTLSGIVLPSHIKPSPGAEAFEQAGFSVTSLPAPFLQQTTAFSPDGQHFLAFHVQVDFFGPDVVVPYIQYTVLCCRTVGQGVEFSERLTLPGVIEDAVWVPSTTCSVYADRQNCPPASTEQNSAVVHVLPSGADSVQLLQGPHPEQVLLSPSGQLLGEVGLSCLRMHELSMGQQVWELDGGQAGRVLHSWLPSGLGFVCSSAAASDGRPSLQVMRFA